MKYLRKALRDRLGLRLVVLTLLISTVFSAVAAGVQLYLSYQRQVGTALQVVDRISASTIEPLQNALWQFDFDQVDIILRGIQSDPAVAHVLLESTTGHTFEFGDPEFVERKNEFALTQTLGDDTQTIGKLSIFLSLESIWASIWAQFLTLIGTNLAKAYVVAFALLIVYYRYVTRHLFDIANTVEQAPTYSEPLSLSLDRSPTKSPDAMDKIVAALNKMSKRSKDQIEELEREIAQRKAAEREAVTASMARKRFLANMSHEIRTPLNAMMGLFQLIEMSDVPERQQQQAATGLAAARVLLSQLTNVLEMSRLEANAVTLNRRDVDMRALATQWADAAKGSVERYEKTLDVLLDVSEDLPATSYIDEKRVTQIVHNLCDNAAKFTTTGSILISLTHEAGLPGKPATLTISVSDSGTGVPTSEIEEIFERFSQIDDSLTRRHSGTGLGLSISSDLAKLMGGILSVESPSSLRNYSTTFSLAIPAESLEGKAA
ncbi:MAG: ATP-binding protein [Ruegeria sp.]